MLFIFFEESYERKKIIGRKIQRYRIQLHTVFVLYCLMEYEPVRFNEMRRYLGNAADKTLSQTLKELERDGLINRKMYPEIPPKVEYTLTERGHSLMKVLDQLCTWGTENRPVE